MGTLTRLSAFLLLLAISAAACGQSLYVFEPFPEYRSTVVSGISDDGTKVSGWNPNPDFSFLGNAFWASTSGQRNDFGFRPNLPPVSFSAGISRDGDVVVGRSQEYRDDSTRAYRYRVSTNTFENLGLFSGVRNTQASGANRDGSVVVGWGTDRFRTDFAFRWREGSGYQSLNIPTSRAVAVSSDGNKVLVGAATRIGGGFIWNEDGTLTALGIPDDGRQWYTGGNGMNHDGSVIVGSAGPVSGGGPQVAVWRDNQIELLGLFEGVQSTGKYTNADGSVIVGEYSRDSQTRSFVWTREGGMENFADYLGRYGITLGEDWVFGTCTGISADGLVFSGNLNNIATGRSRGFVATIPTPASLVLTLGGLFATCPRRRSP